MTPVLTPVLNKDYSDAGSKNHLLFFSYNPLGINDLLQNIYPVKVQVKQKVDGVCKYEKPAVPKVLHSVDRFVP